MRAGRQTHCTAFKGARCIAAGELADVARKAKAAIDKGEQVMIFDDATSESIEVDFRGSAEDVLRRLAQPDGNQAVTEEPRSPGHAETGRRRANHVVRRGIRIAHAQPRGHRSLRRARWRRQAREQRPCPPIRAAYRFMSVMAGNRPGSRGDAHPVCWSPRPFRPIGFALAEDVRHRASTLAADALNAQPGAAGLLKS